MEMKQEFLYLHTVDVAIDSIFWLNVAWKKFFFQWNKQIHTAQT